MKKKLILFISLTLIIVVGVFVIAQQGEEPEVIENVTYIDYQINKYDLGNGSFAQTSYLGYVNYYNGSEFRPINTTLVPYNFDGYDYAMTKSNYHLYIKSHSNWGDGVKYCVEDNGTEYCLTYQSQDYSYRDKYGSQDYISSIIDRVGTVNGSSIMYPDVFPDVDLFYSLFNSLLKQDYILKSRPRTPATYLATPITLDFGGYIKFPDLIMQVNGSNMSGNFITQEQIDFVHDGKVLFYLPKPYAYDSNDNSINLQYEVKTQKQEIWFYVKTPYSWLNDSERVYPVYIDPSSQVRSAGLGETIDSGPGSGAWSNPTNIYTSNNVYARRFLVSADPYEFTEWLRATWFNFDIPEDATINGIMAEFEKKAELVDMEDYEVKIVRNAVEQGNDKAKTGVSWPLTDTYVSYGSSSDLWGIGWDTEDINNETFGVSISAIFKGPEEDSSNAYVDHVRITVYYTEPVQNFYVNVGDSWQTATDVYVNVGDVWQDVEDVYVNVGDVWRQIY